ncbi:hypothetical protein F4778DRAFT_780902 [Xylariomycetidae sp. FL2044]|nr:hypothetical protein F4778DRAFT_780902 [Xylariomycetidae sp. FL2044]
MYANYATVASAIVACLALPALASPTPDTLPDALDTRSKITLGGIDTNLACEIQQGPGWKSESSIWRPCYGWTCVKSGQDSTSINMDVACSSQYSQPNAYASCSAGKYGWKCYLK